MVSLSISFYICATEIGLTIALNVRRRSFLLSGLQISTLNSKFVVKFSGVYLGG